MSPNLRISECYGPANSRDHSNISAVLEIQPLEALEQLRVLWNGERIAVHVSKSRPGPGVDTPEDLARVRAMFA